jgi:hypothetical protein
VRPVVSVSVGQRFGYWTVIALRAGNNKSLCRCRCGREVAVSRKNLRRAVSTQCRPCFTSSSAFRAAISKAQTRHGHSRSSGRSPEYGAWRGMLGRCEERRHPSYRFYGARGIRVAAEWRGNGGFERFLAHVGMRPSPLYSLDRIETNDNYRPGNVRWATTAEQHRNKRSNHFLTISGRTLCLEDWARTSGLNRHTIFRRLERGWPLERVLDPVVYGGPGRGLKHAAQIRTCPRCGASCRGNAYAHHVAHHDETCRCLRKKAALSASK